MTNLQKSTLPPPIPSIPEEWIERIFQRMENYYMSLWKDRFGSIPRERVKQAWAEELADYSAIEIKRGLDTCKTMKFPPTLPEFLTSCRPVIDAKTEWAEACEQMRIRLEGRGADVWSRPHVYWAAVSIGWYDLNSTSWDQIRTRWVNALTNAKEESIPEYCAALPSPGKQVVTRTEAADRMGELLNMVGNVILPGTTKAGTKWAYTLMEREANGESLNIIASKYWREALGYEPDADAKEMFKTYQKKELAA